MFSIRLPRAVGAMAAVFAALCGSLPSAIGVQLHDGLITYWPLNEGSGDTIGDAAPGGSFSDTGTLRNSPTWVSSKFGAGLQFNGIDQDVLIPSSVDMDVNTNAVTLSAWVKLDLLPSELAGSYGGILDSQPDNYVMYLDKGNNELRFKATNASNVTTATHPGIRASMLNTSDWLHVMGVYDGDRGRSQIYFNGQLADQSYNTNPGAGFLTGPIRAGQVSGLGSQVAAEDPFDATNLFQGMISDVAIWNRALGGAEAQYLYNGGTGHAVGAANPNIEPLPPVTPSLPTAQPVIYYKFDGDLTNSGTGGASLDATLHDVAGRNDTLFSPAKFGDGLDLRENPTATSSAEDPGDYLSVGYTLPDSGTIATHFTANVLENYVSLWANSSHENDWEAWIYGDGRVAARGNRATPTLARSLFLEDDPSASHHYAFTWERDGSDMLVSFYMDGEFVGSQFGAWTDPGSTFFIAGGVADSGNANHLGNGIFDDFRIYDEALSEAEVLYLSMFAPEVVDTLAGDFNDDGKVDAADYTVWRDGLGTEYTQDDYLDWKNNFGASLGSGAGAAASVPEPATGLFALLATVLGVVFVRFGRNGDR